MSLSVGLAVGFAAAGAVAGAGLKVAGDFISAFSLGAIGNKGPSGATCVLVGGLAGGVFGYAAGEGYDYLTSDRPEQPSAIIQQCYDSTPDGKKVVIAQDAIGNPICSYE